MLSDAIEVATESLDLHSREPLGAGSVTGFQTSDAEPLLYFVDTSGLPVPAETGWSSGDARIWMHPADPHLPALAPIAFDHASEALLARLGIATSSAPQIIAYRPGRRAVLRVAADGSNVWVKVTRPSRVEKLVRAYAAVADAGIPAPRVHGWSPDGLVVMADAAGIPAAEYLWNAEQLLDTVEGLRAQLARVSWEEPFRGVAGRMRWYSQRSSERARAILDRASGAIDEVAGSRTPIVVHGDLHYGQLFLGRQGEISSVIDVDTLGVADPAEDPAAFLAHAIVSAGLTGDENRARVWELADAAADRWCGDIAVPALAAVHLVGHSISASDRGDDALADGSLSAAEAVLRGEAPSAGGG